MGKTKIWIKNNLLFFISIITLVISLGFSISFISINRATSEGDGTRVGHIYLGSDENRYTSILSSSINDFKDNAKYQISYQDINYDMDFDLVLFQINDTLDQLNVGANNSAIFNIDKSSLENDLTNQFGNDFINLIDIDSLVDDIKLSLANLQYFQEIDLYTYLNETSKSSTLGQASFIDVKESILSQFDEDLIFNIGSKGSFSIIEQTNDLNYTEETLSFISHAILDVTLESPFNHYQFITDHSSDFNIIILKNNDLDFTFYNPYDQEFQIVLSKNNNDILIELIGPPLINTYTYESISSDLPFETIYEDDETLTDPSYMVEDTDTYTFYQKTQVDGVDGELNQIIRHTQLPNGHTLTEVLYYHRVQAINELIMENTVQKEGG